MSKLGPARFDHHVLDRYFKHRSNIVCVFKLVKTAQSFCSADCVLCSHFLLHSAPRIVSECTTTHSPYSLVLQRRTGRCSTRSCVNRRLPSATALSPCSSTTWSSSTLTSRTDTLRPSCRNWTKVRGLDNSYTVMCISSVFVLLQL